MRNSNVTRIAALSMFLALAVLLNYVENLIPIVIPIPGVKLGLANTMNLIVLYFFGRHNYFLIGFLRVLLISILFNGLFTNGFFLSMSGFFLSSICVLLFSISKHLSLFSLSIISAIAHGTGQIICSVFLFALPTGPNLYYFTYLPILIISGLITGVLIAYISKLTISKLEKMYFFKKSA